MHTDKTSSFETTAIDKATQPARIAENGATHTAAARAKLAETGSHIRQAAHLAGDAARNAARAAGNELNTGGRAAAEELSEAARSGADLAHEARGAAGEQIDHALSKGRVLLQSAQDLVREHPLASVGVVFAAGLLLSRMGRR